MTFEQYAGPEPEADAVCAGVWRLMRTAWEAAVSATREEDRNAVCEHCREVRAVFDKGWAWVHEYHDEAVQLHRYNEDLEELGFSPREYELFRSFIARPHGILLVTGPTGSGKTTTLYSALKNVATPR